MEKLTKTEIKRMMQKLIMDRISIAGYALYEGYEYSHLTEEQKEEAHAELKKQMDRVAKIMGYDEAWFN